MRCSVTCAWVEVVEGAAIVKASDQASILEVGVEARFAMFCDIHGICGVRSILWYYLLLQQALSFTKVFLFSNNKKGDDVANQKPGSLRSSKFVWTRGQSVMASPRRESCQKR